MEHKDKGLLELIEMVKESIKNDVPAEVYQDHQEHLDLLGSQGFNVPLAAIRAKTEPIRKERRARAEGYIEITTKAIEDFLKRKVDAYNREHAELRERLMNDDMRDAPGVTVISHKTNHFRNIQPGQIGRFEWVEVQVQDYCGIPPVHALKALAQHVGKQVFDYFTVASVRGVPDPVILGRIANSDSRFYIPGTQWGEDIRIDDLI